MHKSLLVGLATATSAFAACQPSQPAACNLDSCEPCYCLGPAQSIANAPVYRLTCNGDVEIRVSALYWKANQDGMEYAIEEYDEESAGTMIEGEYISPNPKARFGFEIGLGYHSPCDGWALELIWKHYAGKASREDQTIPGQKLLVLWSAYNGAEPPAAHAVIAGEIETHWNVKLDAVDLNLGRKYWVSKYVMAQPFIGLRRIQLNQDLNLIQGGGSWSHDAVNEPNRNDYIRIDNDFRGIGVRGGFDLNFGFGCGFSVYSQLAAFIVYGQFNVEHKEIVREAEAPFSKSPVLQTYEKFKASRGGVDLGLGIQYATLVCDCKYGFLAQLGWEQYLFFHQNQMWRVNRHLGGPTTPFPNNNGENVFHQRRGTLSTHGLTLTFKFDF